MLLLFTIMNKENFINGIKKIALAISFAFVGPYLIHQAFQNKNKRQTHLKTHQHHVKTQTKH